jgi:hypothetical protein
LLDGLTSISKRSIKFADYYKFVSLLGVTAIALVLRHRKSFQEWASRRLAAALFCALFFLGYLLLYAWYGAVVTDSRFLLTLFLPFIFSASIVINELTRDRTITLGGRKFSVTSVVAATLVALALIDVCYNAERLIAAPVGNIRIVRCAA